MSQSGESSLPPAQIMMNFVLGLPVSRIVGAAAELGIPRVLGEGAKSAEGVAGAVGTLPAPTYRVLRALTALGVLAESDGHLFSLTPVGECLLPDRPGSFDALAKLNNAGWMSQAYAGLVETLRTGKAAFNQAQGQGLFEFLGANPAEQDLFGRAMSTFSGMEVELVLGAYDFSRAKHVVDVGGGHGLLLSRVLAANPHARGTLFDQPEVAKQANASFADAAIRSRCEVVGGDFFAHAPTGGDLYLLKHILHDWDDTRAVKILQAISKAMAPGARLLVMEQGIAAPGIPNPGKVMDVIMLMLLEGGRERSAEEHRALFERVGIRFEREISTPGPIMLFEGVRT